MVSSHNSVSSSSDCNSNANLAANLKRFATLAAGVAKNIALGSTNFVHVCTSPICGNLLLTSEEMLHLTDITKVLILGDW